MCPVVLFAPPRGVAALAAFFILSLTHVSRVHAQDATQSAETLPPIDVISTRIGTRPSSGSSGSRRTSDSSTGHSVTTSGNTVTGGIAGASTTIITAEDIARAPAQTLPDILSREPGIQVTNLFGGVNGARSAVDMRGFGAAAPSNTLVLINGRRINDLDIAGVDLASIPRDSIDRIEITRGNSGAVLYGDGAVGGVINIVTKSGIGIETGGAVRGRLRLVQIQGRQCIVQRLEGALVGEPLQQRHQFRRLSRQQLLPAAQWRRRSPLHL